MALHGPGPQLLHSPHQGFHQHTPDGPKGQALAESLLSYPSPQIYTNPLKKELGQVMTPE